MDVLPWHVQLKIYKGIGIDNMRKLGIKPGKLQVPRDLEQSLGRCMQLKKYNNKVDGWSTDIKLMIQGTDKYYFMYRYWRDDDRVRINIKLCQTTYLLSQLAIVMRESKVNLPDMYADAYTIAY